MKKLTKLSKIFLAFATLLAVSISSFVGVLSAGIAKAYADYSASTIEASHFSETSSSWVLSNNGQDGTLGGNSNLTLENFNNNFSATKPSSVAGDDDYILALYATGAETKTSDEKNVYNYFTKTINGLIKNSYYCLSFYCQTYNATATVKISNIADHETIKLTSNDDWTLYTLFFTTPSEAVATNPKLLLCYGSFDSISPSESPVTGYVCFDEVTIKQVSVTDYMNKTVNGEAVSGTVLASFDATSETTVNSALADQTFNSNLSVYPYFEEQNEFKKSEADNFGWYYYAPQNLTSLAKTNYVNGYNAKTTALEPIYFNASTILESDDFEDNSTFGTDNKVLKIVNNTSDLSLGLVSKSFKIDQFGYYRISVMVKSDNTKASATLKVLSNIPTGANPYKYNTTDHDNYASCGALFTGEHTLTASGTQEYSNNWKEVVVYVRGYCFDSANIRIALLASANSTIYFDNIKVEKVTSEPYDNLVSQSSSTYALDLSPTSLIQSDSVTNGYFNRVKINDATKGLDKPLEPTSWAETLTGYSELTVGIVPTNRNVFKNGSALETNLGGAPNPTPSGSPEINVFAIYSDPAKYPTTEGDKIYSVKSNQFYLSQSSVYKITFEVFTSNSNNNSKFNGTLKANLLSDDKTILNFSEDYTIGTGTWETFTIVVNTGSQSRYFKLDLGIENAKGTVFFRNVKCTSVTESYSELLEENGTLQKQIDNKIRFADFVGDSGTMHTVEKVPSQDYYESKNYNVVSKEEDSISVSGEVYLVQVKPDTTVTVGPASLEYDFLKLDSAKTDMAMVISNNTAKETLVYPISSVTLTSSSYYKISVWMKTATAHNHLSIKLNNLTLDGETVTFVEADPQTVTDNNGYKQYIAYVKTGTKELSGVAMQFILGVEGARESGYAVVRDVDFAKLTESEFTAQTTGLETDAYTKLIDLTADETPTSETEETEDTENDKIDKDTQLVIFFVVFSSILLFVSIVIALVATIFKKKIKPAKKQPQNQANITKTNKNLNEKNRKDGFV